MSPFLKPGQKISLEINYRTEIWHGRCFYSLQLETGNGGENGEIKRNCILNT